MRCIFAAAITVFFLFSVFPVFCDGLSVDEGDEVTESGSFFLRILMPEDIPDRHLDYTVMIKGISTGQTLNINYDIPGSMDGYYLGPDFEENTQQGLGFAYKNIGFGFSQRKEGVDYFLDLKHKKNRLEIFYKQYENYVGTYEMEPSDEDLTEFPDLSTMNFGVNYIRTFFSDDLLLALNDTLPDPRLVLTPYFRLTYGYGELENNNRYDFFSYPETSNLNSYSFHNVSAKLGASLIIPIWKFYGYGGADFGPVLIYQDEGDLFLSDKLGFSGYLGFGFTSRYFFFSMKWIQVDLYNQIDNYNIQFLNGNFEALIGLKI